MSSNTQKKKNDNSIIGTCIESSLIIVGVFAVCALFAASIYHVYLSIAGLAGVSNSDIRELCNSSAINTTSDYTYIGDDPSEIWMYVLTSLLFVTGGLGNNVKSITEEKEDGTSLTLSEAMCGINCSAILYGSFCGWGWDQIWNSGTCLEHNFGNETLMTSARIHFYMQATICGLIAFIDIMLILGFIGALMYEKCSRKQPDSPRVVNDPHLRQVITGEGDVIRTDRSQVYGVPAERTTV